MILAFDAMRRQYAAAVTAGLVRRSLIDSARVERWLVALEALTLGHASGRRPQLPAQDGQNERALALGRSNWLFAGSLLAGKRAAAIMSLLHSARINGHDPYAYFKDVLERLPTHPASRIDKLLPHRWSPSS
jgi:hypothetical protein